MSGVDIAETCLRLKLSHTRYRMHAKAVQRLESTARSLVVSAMSTSPAARKLSLKARYARAGAIVDRAFAGRAQDPTDRRLYGRVKGDLAVLALAREPLASTCSVLKRDMEKHASELPVAQWQQGILGLSGFGLAVIVGETGDLSNYPNPAKVWKRLGLTPFEKNGVTRAGSTWRIKGGLTNAEWQALGYASRRRAALFAYAAQPLFLHQTKGSGYYRAVYDERRKHTKRHRPEWRNGHQHADALRYMTKRFILDLWSEWGRAVMSVSP